MSLVPTEAKGWLGSAKAIILKKDASSDNSDRSIMRRTRRLWLVGIPLMLFFYVVFYCNSAIWESLNINTHPLDNIITGSGFRKLLEERARLAEKLHSGEKIQRLPQCIIIGVRKCGTRALLEFMDLHPTVEIAQEEVHFFDDRDNYGQGLSWYLKKMPMTLSNQYTVEKTPRYFIDPSVPDRIKSLNSSIKLLVILRNPTTRVVSDYTQIYYNKLARNETHEDFERLVLDPFTGEINVHYRAIQISIYHQFFPRWFSTFSKDQIHIVDGDNLIVDPVSEISQIENFLGIENRITYNTLYFNRTRGFYCMRFNKTAEKCLGASKGRKHPDLEPSVIKKMKKFFRPHNERLFRILKRRFNWS
ncbi:heparan sulfate glucosamine 3-O-sulfotransferase 5-like [Haliotis rufescens]|uniref:heparan sulfate glucosamine 3-O-sulfotransferase 5-like n=1 Tax=Haliotis rufescens TaxID=6454 RepID=UPI001EB03147|nr:heparan sulfate glucosamine 3-O-sulfotransferase 5-like [Haliotis rufescens]XP_046366431.1 heparan sulfate glucosamine 3-O-sulfotransferase 5-like [Haliotis rufescens]XP_046366441.1 heparan sulfate glucosamine 3-O-sulfotransferase 5-like [Haliotis rufescens]XP_046366449.1 heparan sulfate glucosamine 3-O-sulfotransferase 5-like [Haliotis rufescens]XP_046366458.1 heparan sulfate glucosamine 3-O-sulfotransferase 5-like [Haliotis rufescens]XP_046366466.1 heparan sulfate glucosamine 3-O-sulfotra